MRFTSIVLAFTAAACVVEQGRAPTSVGDGLVLDPATNTVSIDPARVAIPPTDCAAGSVVVRKNSKYECVPVAQLSPDQLPTGFCRTGEFLVRGEDAWKCTPSPDLSHTPSIGTCGVGLYIRKTADGWACSAPVDPAVTPVVTSCTDGQFVQNTAGGWACAPAVDPAKTPVVTACADGEFVQRSGDGWACAKALDPASTPSVSSCQTGLFLRKSASGWECVAAVDPAKTPVVGVCDTGKFPRRTADGWDCVPALDPTQTPVLPTCADGRYLRKKAGGFECAALEGDLSGVADNVRGTVGVANGGTGANTLAGKGVLVMDAAGAQVTSLAPGAADGILGVGAAGDWGRRSALDLNLIRRSSGALSYFVRPGGSDTACSGLVDADVSSTGGCAFATPQRALRQAPDLLEHALTITVADGNYRSAATGAVGIDVRKVVGVGGSITIKAASTSAVLSGAASTNGPAVGSVGLAITGVDGVVVQGLKFEKFVDAGLSISGSQVTVADVTLTNNTVGLVASRAAAVTLTGTNNVIDDATGISIRSGSRLSLSNPAGFNVGKILGTGCTTGLEVVGASSFNAATGTTIDVSTTTRGVDAINSQVTLSGVSTILTTGPTGLRAAQGASLTLGGTFTYTASAGTATVEDAVVLAEVGSALVLAPAADSKLKCTGASTTRGIVVRRNSTVDVAPPTAKLTMEACEYGAIASYQSSIVDCSTCGSRTYSATGTKAYVAVMASAITRGAIAASALTCASGSICP